MDKDIIAEAKDAFAEAVEADSEQRKRELDDLKFARLGEQWPEKVKKAREEEGRPCLTINRQPAFIRQVVNDSRQNKPSIKVHPADSGADIATAKIYDGLIRNIEYTSSADVAYDTGIDHAASMGRGYWRVLIDYACNDSFDLDLKIKRVSNPFTVYGDPYSEEADSSDWNTAFVSELLPEKAFKAMYQDAEAVSWEGGDGLWHENDDVRVAEYWKRAEVEKTLLLLSDGTAIMEEDFMDASAGVSAKDIAAAQGVTVVKTRMTKGYEVKQYTLTANEVLDTKDWPGIYIPIIPVYGEEINVEGKKYYYSLIHQSKDAQRMFNYWRTASTELVALAPKAPFVGEEGAFDSDPNWSTANVKSHPYLEHAKGKPMPQRQPFAGPPAGALQEALNAADDMKSILGIYDASLGQRSNETSGRAIMARQKEGDTSTFHFIDNLTRAIRHTGRILIDLIPHVYTAERVVRVMGEDGMPQTVTINTQEPGPDGLMRKVNDVRAGKYDLTVASGPNYTTRRQEAADQMMQLVQSFPEAAPVIGDIIAKNLDWPGAEEIAERLKAVNPVLQQQAQAGQPPAPDPKMIEAQQKGELAQQAMAMKQQESQANLAIKQQEMAAKLLLKDKEIEGKMAQQERAMQQEFMLAMTQMKAEMMGEMHRTAMQQHSEREARMMEPQGPVATVQIDGKQELMAMSDMVTNGVNVIADAMTVLAETQQAASDATRATAAAATALAGAAQTMAAVSAAPKQVTTPEGRTYTLGVQA